MRWFALMAVGASVSVVRADLIATDSLAYSPGSLLNSQSGGSGWTGAWREVPATSTVDSTGLHYSNGGDLLVAGGAARSSSGASNSVVDRFVGRALGANPESVWFSFLARVDSSTGGLGYSVLSMGSGLNSYSISLAQFHASDTVLTPVVADGAGGATGIAGHSVAFGETAFLVAQVNFQAGADTIRLWANPALGQGLGAADASLSTRDLGSVSSIRMQLGSLNSAWFDEVRVGQNSQDVMPTPTPGSGVLLALAGMAKLRRRRS